MNHTERNWILLKIFIFEIFYAMLHFIHDLLPYDFVAIFGGTNESVYTHMKLAFYAYLFTILLEFFVFKKDIENRNEYLNIKMLSLLLIPWLELIVWYIQPMFFGEIPSEFVELSYSIVVLIICVLWLSLFELNCKIECNKTSQYLLLIMVIIMVIGFTVFTFKDPWIDIFVVGPIQST